jgi:hypothetical protein
LPPGTFGVVAIVINARAQAGAAGGPSHIDLGVRTAGVDHWSSDLALPASLGVVSNVFTTDPGTGVAFNPSDISAAGFNIGVKSIA